MVNTSIYSKEVKVRAGRGRWGLGRVGCGAGWVAWL